LIVKGGNYTKEEEEFLENWLRSYLYERKFLLRDDILNVKNHGYLSFKNATEILNELCVYNE
jgi:hypothetical protein